VYVYGYISMCTHIIIYI